MIETVTINIKRLSEEFSDIPLPEYETEGSSGMDIRAAVRSSIVIEKGKIGLVPTNLSVEIPVGYEIQVRPRSGLALKHGIAVLNSPGTIDSDYRGEVKIILMNLGEENFEIKRGDRIAQLVVAKTIHAKLNLSNELNESKRNSGGFGHTGTK